MKTAHTPSPWRVVPSTCGGGTARRDVVSDGAAFSPSFVAGDILEADAQLIASAPELLAALRSAANALAVCSQNANHALTWQDMSDDCRGTLTAIANAAEVPCEAIRTAIARATGGEK